MRKYWLFMFGHPQETGYSWELLWDANDEANRLAVAQLFCDYREELVVERTKKPNCEEYRIRLSGHTEALGYMQVVERPIGVPQRRVK